MARDEVLIDANVIVAAFTRDDTCHAVSKELLASSRSTMVTCWPVVTEAAYLLRRTPGGVTLLLDFCASARRLKLIDIRTSDLPEIAAWMARYAEHKPDLADACLIFLADQHLIHSIATFDRDFLMYRTASGRTLQRLPG